MCGVAQPCYVTLLRLTWCHAIVEIFRMYLASLHLFCRPEAAKNHVIAFGKVQNIAEAASGEEKPIEFKVRALYVDGKVKEYTIGPARDITEQTFVVRQATRINDALPDEEKPRWRWERGGWMSVNRSTGRISPLTLPGFDSSYSAAVWYRDYAAYCGTSDDRKKLYAIVVQLGHRKPLLRQQLQGASLGADSACPAPRWQRDPARVTFQLSGGQQLTFSVGERHAELAAEAEADDTE